MARYTTSRALCTNQTPRPRGGPQKLKEYRRDVLSIHTSWGKSIGRHTEDHPHLQGKHASIHPCKHTRVMKKIIEVILSSRADPEVDNHYWTVGFALPRKTIKPIDQILRRFHWSGEAVVKNQHAVNWSLSKLVKQILLNVFRFADSTMEGDSPLSKVFSKLFHNLSLKGRNPQRKWFGVPLLRVWLKSIQMVHSVIIYSLSKRLSGTSIEIVSWDLRHDLV
ncbi:Autophagy-related protein 3 [Acorus gramineus]|uniref:Autophagy-related protein 3 n=1 Tax=Acorus gramineus TaxID=55184 RepID=A0AAV9A5I8_ACOGR|nr:Autophagy-related protein 3 [Acorus gramineus]